MAVDKLVDSTQLNADLTSVANAIRTRGGTSAQLAFPNGFITAIEDIPDTGSYLNIVYEDNGNGSFTFLTPYSDIKSAVQNEDAVSFMLNGTFAVGGVVDYRTNYTTQSVTFTECVRLYMQDDELDIYLVTYGYSGGTLQQVSELKYLIPSGTKSITANGAGIDVKRYASVDVNVSGGNPNENLLKLAKDALTSVEIDLGGVSMKERTFNSAKALENIKIWNLGASSGQYICYNCTNLLKAVVTGQGNNVHLPSNTFNNCTKLTAVDLTDVNLNQGSAMIGASAMNVLVIRNSAVAPLGNINVFQNTPFASGKAGGTLYVPSSLISSYQGATNWATILGYSTNSIQAIEGSQYENSYVDGTPIS